MRGFAVALVIASLSVVASAQTVERTLDFTGLGWGTLYAPMLVETDGDLSTREWLLHSVDTGLYRVVAERTGLSPCVGAWFNPRSSVFASVSLQRDGLRHVLIVQAPSSARYAVVRLDHPQCG